MFITRETVFTYLLERENHSNVQFIIGLLERAGNIVNVMFVNIVNINFANPGLNMCSQSNNVLKLY